MTIFLDGAGAAGVPGLIRQRRKEKGWSQFDLAEKVGVTRNTVNRWERWNQPNPSHREKLAKVLGGTASDYEWKDSDFARRDQFLQSGIEVRSLIREAFVATNGASRSDTRSKTGGVFSEAYTRFVDGIKDAEESLKRAGAGVDAAEGFTPAGEFAWNAALSAISALRAAERDYHARLGNQDVAEEQAQPDSPWNLP
jgi:transcriptional regulator with XRE-family HTH domain